MAKALQPVASVQWFVFSISQIAKGLPSEPDESSRHAKLRFRGTCGSKQLQRRFLADAPLSQVFAYLASEGYSAEDHKLLSSWPRRDVSNVLSLPNNNNFYWP